ncbi:MAG: hypothetical protein DMG68_07590 [Acidobacteria bacterium]|nr:MAG: hypothetical protein DMG68_07590 [Acidobacteriota bacterium]
MAKDFGERLTDPLQTGSGRGVLKRNDDQRTPDGSGTLPMAENRHYQKQGNCDEARAFQNIMIIARF